VSGEILPALERFVLPNACVSCERPVETRAPDALVCGVCRGRMRPLPTGCHRCRQPLPAVGACRFCAAWPATLRWVRSAVWLGPEARALVHHLKYDYPSTSGHAGRTRAHPTHAEAVADSGIQSGSSHNARACAALADALRREATQPGKGDRLSNRTDARGADTKRRRGISGCSSAANAQPASERAATRPVSEP
jgi:hypothetical protein